MWACKGCDWRGESPSWSDASYTRQNEWGGVEWVRDHLPICPECFKVVEKEKSNVGLYS